MKAPRRDLRFGGPATSPLRRMNVGALLDSLRKLELETHQPHVRADHCRLGRLLHPNFFEVGRSGAVYSRESVLAEFSNDPPSYRVWSQDFQIEPLTENLALLTYRSAHVADDGTLERHTLRASLWQRTDRGWQLRFHQGTPAGGVRKTSVNNSLGGACRRCRSPTLDDCERHAARRKRMPTHSNSSHETSMPTIPRFVAPGLEK